MNESLFRFSNAVHRNADVERWLDSQSGELGNLARFWFNVIRHCGDDVQELLHDERPTACVNEAAFAYVDRYQSHVGVGFFCGFVLEDPQQILEGTGKRMRHIKLRPENEANSKALTALIHDAYQDMKKRTTKD